MIKQAPLPLGPTMVTISVRAEVARIAEAMEARLAAYDATRGDGWRQQEVGDLMDGLDSAVEDMFGAVGGYKPGKAVDGAAADVANRAMFVAEAVRSAGKIKRGTVQSRGYTVALLGSD